MAHWGGLVSFHESHCQSLRWLNIIPDIPLLLTRVSLDYPNCSTATLSGGYMTFQVSYCHLLRWLCIFPDVSLLLTGVASHYFRLLTGVALCNTNCTTSAYCGDSLWFHKYHIIVHWDSSTWSELSHCNLWLFVIPGFSLSHRSNCHLLWWLSVVPGVLLLLTLVALYCLRCLTTDHLGHFVSFQGLISTYRLTLCHFRCPTAADCFASV